MKKILLFATLAFSLSAQAQSTSCGFGPGQGCASTDYTNSYMASTDDAATIEYDNFVSTFHSSIIRDAEGNFKVWGECIGNGGDSTDFVLSPIVLDSANYPALGSAKVLKVTGASIYGQHLVQFIALTDSGLYAWGKEGMVISDSITSSSTFQRISIGGNANGLPTGVSPADVKMMVASVRYKTQYLEGTPLFVSEVKGTLMLVTCNGAVWVLSQEGNMRGNGNTGNDSTWYRVTRTGTGSPYLSNVVAARMGGGTAMALTSSGTVYTWGKQTFNGDGATGATDRSRATLMTLPAGTPKMIGVTPNARVNPSTFYSFLPAYYILMTNGNLYTLGGNDRFQLGVYEASTFESNSWIQPQYTSVVGRPVMDDIYWISPQEHDGTLPAINVLTKDSVLYCWGDNSYRMLGRHGGGWDHLRPGIPDSLSSSTKVISVETGGHTTMITQMCETNYGYSGHRINGSMGNGDPAYVIEPRYTFETAYTSVCASQISYISIDSNAHGNLCLENTYNVGVSPAGGTLSVVSGAGILAGDVLTLTDTGSVQLRYISLTAPCGDADTVFRTYKIEECSPTISGNVYNDANGLTDSTVNGLGTNAGAVLYAILYDNTTGMVVDTAVVNTDGSYDVSGVKGNNLSIYISTTPTATNQTTIPAVTLPDGWIMTGDMNCGVAPLCSGSDGITNGILNIGVFTNTITEANFGVEKRPESDSVSQTIPYPTGGIISAGVVGIDVVGTDYEQGALNGSNAPIMITALPDNSLMYYAGAAVVLGDTIASFDPNLLSFDGITIGSTNTAFLYSFIDSAGAQSDVSGEYLLDWGIPLPVSMLSFNAYRQGNTVGLFWATATEQNNKGFDIERSADANTYESIGFLKSLAKSGNSTARLDYSFTDLHPYIGLNYYRLKQTDFDGKYEYTIVRSVAFDASNSINVFPNPTRESITVSGLVGDEQIVLIDINGRKVQSIKVKGKQSVTQSLDSLENGVYLIQIIRNETIISTHKVQKVK